MLLAELLKDCKKQVITTVGSTEVPVEGICSDSRIAQAGHVFVAIKGVSNDGHTFIEKVLQQGGTIIVAEKPAPEALPEGITWTHTTDSAQLMGQMASAYYRHPSRSMEVVGVTGTNGKTTIATLLFQTWTEAGHKCGLVSTVENRIGTEVVPSTHTTPDTLRLQALFAQMRDAGCSHVFMEVSSHAVHQRRIAGTRFVGGIFSNLTHDHLDYHGTFAAYLKAKKLFFDELPKQAFAVTNLDDRNGRVMLQNTKAQQVTYALRSPADVKGKVIENALSGLHLQVNDQQIHARLIGAFNASNLLAVYASSTKMGMDQVKALTILSNLRGAEGRFEYIAHPTLKNCGGIVDYAHTPDALEKVLETIQHMLKAPARLYTVVGCGGDRDRTKRPIMARMAAERSHLAILTSDNPRTEDANAILAEMETGLDGVAAQKWLTISDRAQAIKTACRMLQPGDVVLVAGKGHEKYQEINGVKLPFDDLQELRRGLT
jgi:UDP-N-acetylmuramoyl-L-alanyl-D-glutamate--2,6-diaminopimelate ligase